MHRSARLALSAAALAAAAGIATAQTTQPTAFVANNGNLEGSVTVFFFNPDGSPQFVSRFITGATGTPGTNAYGISLSPDGRFLAVTHATASQTVEQVDILRVNPDGTLTSAGVFQVPDSPLGVAWVASGTLAITETRLSNPNFIRIYRYNETGPTLTQLAFSPIQGFMSAVAALPSAGLIFCPESSTSSITAFRVDASGTLTNLGQTFTSPTFPLSPTISPLGNRLFAFGGISNAGNKILAFDLNPAAGALTPIAGSPYAIGGASPKGGAVTRDGTILAVAHGTDATVRTYTLDAAGVPTATGWLYDVGIQGDLGTVAFLDLPTRRVLLATDKFNSGNGTGLLSFTLNTDGTATLNGPVVSTQGPTPEFMTVWQPITQTCYANCDASTGTPALTPADFVCFLNKFRAGDPYANCDASTGTPALTPADFVCFLNKFRAGC